MSTEAPRRMFDHFTFNVPEEKFDAVVSWYLAALAPIKYEKIADFPWGVGLGANQQADFWILKDALKTGYFQLAFRAQDHKTVEAFHEAAVKAGGVDNGKPGIRQMYDPNYYAAFVLDPLGNNIEMIDRLAH